MEHKNKNLSVHVKKDDAGEHHAYFRVPKDHHIKKERLVLAVALSFFVIVALWLVTLKWNFDNLKDNDESDGLNLGETFNEFEQTIQGATDELTNEFESLEEEFNELQSNTNTTDANTNSATNTNSNLTNDSGVTPETEEPQGLP